MIRNTDPESPVGPIQGKYDSTPHKKLTVDLQAMIRQEHQMLP